MKSKLVLAVCLICLSVLKYAQAAPDLNLRVDTGAAGQAFQYEELLLNGPDAYGAHLVTHKQVSTTTNATWTAEGTARGQAGSVGAWSYAAVDGLVGGSAQYAQTSSFAQYTDKIRFSGTGNVTLRIDAEVLFDLDGSANPTAPGMGGSGSAFAGGGIAAFSQWYWGGNLKEWAICNGVNGCGSYGWLGEAVPEGLHAYSFEITIPTTTTLDIRTRLNSEATAGLYNNLTGQLNGGTASWTTSALNSLRNGVTILTPGVTLSSDSGFDYVFVSHATSVPEPTTLALLGLGLAGLGFSRRKQ